MKKTGVKKARDGKDRSHVASDDVSGASTDLNLSWFRKLTRWLIYLCAASVMLLALLVGIARLLLPLVPEYQDDIRRWAAEASGFDVQFENISASWPLAGPELRFIDVTVGEIGSDEALFVANDLRVGISLLTLLTEQRVMLNRVGIDGSNLTVQRTLEGEWTLQGRPVDELLPRQPDQPIELPNIRIGLADIRLTFSDRTRNESIFDIAIDELDVRLTGNRLAVDGDLVLPAEFGERAAISAEIPWTLFVDSPTYTGVSSKPTDAAEPSWRVFVDATGAQVGAMVQYAMNRPFALREAKGDVTIAAQFSGRLPDNILLELDLADVILQINDQRIEQYEALDGRLEWAGSQSDWLLAGTGLVFARGELFAPRSDFSLGLSTTDGRQQLTASANVLRLQDLYPFLLAAEAENLLEGLVAADQRLPTTIGGDLENLDLELVQIDETIDRFQLSVDLNDIGIAGLEAGESVSGISGNVVADEGGGRAQLVMRDGTLTLPAIFAGPVQTESVEGLLVWLVTPEKLRLMSDNVQIETSTAKAGTRFELVFPANDPTSVSGPESGPTIDLTAQVKSSDAPAIVKLLPLKKLPEPVARWLGQSIRSGKIDNADIEFRGPLKSFPFRNNEGVFKIDVDASDGELKFAKQWPAIKVESARITFDRTSLTSKRNRGTFGGIKFQDGDVVIADLKKGLLQVKARETTTVPLALTFLRNSPVAASVGPILDAATGDGNISGNFELTLPLGKPRDYSLIIDMTAANVSLGLEKLDWGLSEIAGNATLRNAKFYSNNLTGTLLGEPVSISMRPAADAGSFSAQNITVAGKTPIQRWMKTLSLPFPDRVTGDADWNALVLIPGRKPEGRDPVHIVIRSDLAGVASTLPVPLAKPADSTAALEVDVAFLPAGEYELSGSLRRELNWALSMRDGQSDGKDKLEIERGAVHAGSAAAVIPDLPGIEFSGRLSFLRFDDWLSLANDDGQDSGQDGGNENWHLPYREAALQIDRASLFGQIFENLAVDVSKTDADWRIVVDGPAAKGNVSIPLNLASGRPVQLAMDRLWLIDSEQSDGGPPADPRNGVAANITVDDFNIGDMKLGKLQVRIVKDVAGLVAENLVTEAPSFSIAGNGAWLVHPNDDDLRQSRLELNLAGGDIAATLIGLGYDPVISGSAMNASADLTWPGGPGYDFLERADGEFSIKMEDGAIIDLEPGGGRLLGVLSLAALPRRLSLDFRDVVNDGLSFDQLQGDFTIDAGNAYTCNLGMEGSVADMGVVGRAGIATRDYNQLAVVRPHVASLLALGGVFVGGPAGGAAVLLFSQIFRKPLSTLGESYYQVTGPWDNPNVQRIQGNKLDATPLRDCEQFLADALAESLKEQTNE